MFWIFASVALLLVVLHKGFRKVVGWIVSGVIAAYLLTAGVLHVQATQNLAAEKADADASQVAWLKANPDGCAKYERASDRLGAYLESGGHCSDPFAKN